MPRFSTNRLPDMYRLNTRVNFEASHKLLGMPEGHKCARLHGHSYKIEVSVASPVLSSVGMIIDTSRIKDTIRNVFDHQDLNDVLSKMRYFQPREGNESFDKVLNPTAENMAEIICDIVEELLEEEAPEEATVLRVAVHETENSFAEYINTPGELDDEAEESGEDDEASKD